MGINLICWNQGIILFNNQGSAIKKSKFYYRRKKPEISSQYTYIITGN